MAQELITSEYPLPKDSYTAFDAISLRNLIVQRMNDQGVFTDQNYIGSNLASIIDIISYAYNTLIFYLNKTSSESTFTEAQLYENISRIVKILDYKPIGYQTSTLTFQCSAIAVNQTNLSFNPNSDLRVSDVYTIPRYSYLMVGGIPFSFNEDITFSPNQQGVVLLDDLSNRKLLYQGSYREAPIYTAAGDENEIVTINTSNTIIDHFNIDVYVYENDSETWVQYQNVSSVYTEKSFARVFEKRLNYERLYEIAFGDDVNGRKLKTGDRVAIYYLQSSGEKGVIGPSFLRQGSRIIYNGVNFESILQDVNAENFNYLNGAQFSNLLFDNVVGSTVPKDIESADNIKKNAPLNFKSQYRIVTKEDCENFITINFSNFVSDVKVFSNWDYTGKYLRYFNDIQVSPAKFRQILFNQVLYSDSCNFNNIYICAVPRISPGSTLKYLLPAQKEAILSNISSLKTMTSEIVFLDPVYKALAFGVKTNDININVSDRDFSVLEVIKTPTSRRSGRSIANDIKRVFENFFNPLNTKLGQMFLYSTLVNSILSIEGVNQIFTKRLDTDERFQGLSFYLWNPSFAEYDKQIIVSDTKMNEFDFLYFDNLTDVFSKIEVVESTTYSQ